MPGRPEESGSSLTELLGGRTGFIDAAGPAIAFVAGWALAGGGTSTSAIWWGSGAALVAGVAFGETEIKRRQVPQGHVIKSLELPSILLILGIKAI